MPDLDFKVTGVLAAALGLTPLFNFQLEVTNPVANESIHSVALQVQIQISAPQRSYTAVEKEKLIDLFGTPERWARTVRPLLWMNTSVVVPRFAGDTVVNLELPCTFDFNVAATKYFHALDAGDIPLCVMFSGTLFLEGPEGVLQVANVPWDREASFRLPIAVWKEMMEMHYPNTSWLCLHRDTFDALYDFKVRHGIPTWEQAIARALAAAETPEEVNT